MTTHDKRTAVFVLVLVLVLSVGVAWADYLIGADICCPQGSIPGCMCFPGVNAAPAPCPPGFGPIPGTDLCGEVLK